MLKSSMGSLTEDQERILQEYVYDKVVFDLGAGNCKLAALIYSLGANRVIAIDKERLTCPEEIETRQMRFEELADQVDSMLGLIDVSFISWPPNRPNYALIKLARSSRVVIYLGSNTNMNACAHPLFFQALLTREILAYAPHPRNTLIVYGDELEQPRSF